MFTSKLGGVYPKAEIQKNDAASHALLKKLCRTGANLRCAECGDSNTCWASVSLRVFVCMRCSQIHRQLGAHISNVKSCMGTYLWAPDELEAMRAGGNALARDVYGGPEPRAGMSYEELFAVASDKYDRKLWYSAQPAGAAEGATAKPVRRSSKARSSKKASKTSQQKATPKQPTAEDDWADWCTFDDWTTTPNDGTTVADTMVAQSGQSGQCDCTVAPRVEAGSGSRSDLTKQGIVTHSSLYNDLAEIFASEITAF